MARKKDAKPSASTAATTSINRHYEALEVKGVWYIRNKHVAGDWALARPAAVQVCVDIADGKVVPSDTLKVVL